MTDGVRPIGAVSPQPKREGDRREAERREAERRGGEADKKAGGGSRDLVPVGERVDHDPATAADPHRRRAPTPGDAQASASAFSAQMIGQGGQRNGIKGGPPVLDSARAAYLGNEYSGEKERRPPVGKAKRTDV